jgi:RNA polymerase sigma-70 factor (ECF subfamily)
MLVHVCFSEAVLAEIPHLRAYARMMTNDLCKGDHEVEETLKRAMSVMDRMSKRTDLRVQLLTILRSFLITSERRHFSVPPEIHEKLNNPFRIRNGHSKSSFSLASALAGLDYEDREAVVLSAGILLSRREAAKLCGCEVSVYDTRLCRGLARLAQLVPGESLGNIADDLAASKTYPLTNMSGGFLEMTAPN